LKANYESKDVYMWSKNIQHPILALSPMADMTDSPFCQVVRQIGGADIVFREMVSSEALVRDNEKTLGMTDFVEAERPIVQQIFGADPETMAKAAEIVMKHSNPEGIDINMGCPVYKLTSNFNGAALMKDPELAASIVREIKKKIGDTSLSVKIRLGWDDPDTFKTFIPVIEKAGADLITIHGRTKVQGYAGASDWERIRQAKEIATVPLLANGDIHQPEQVWECLEQTGADGVLIARGALGNPWFFKSARSKNNDIISIKERIGVILEHARLHVAQYGERGIVTFRKHLSWYFKSTRFSLPVPGIKEFRSELVRVNSIDELEKILKRLEEYIKKISE
jgi:tRNA-dihydrouridine synthase B